MHVKGWILILGMTVSWPAILFAQDASDSSAIRHTALDDIDRWHEGDAERVERAVHPRLAKRIVRHRTGGVESEWRILKVLWELSLEGKDRMERA